MGTIGFRDVFVAFYESDSSVVWVRTAGAPGHVAEGLGMASRQDGELFVTGYFRSNTSLTHLAVFGRGEPNETTLRFDNNEANDKVFVAQYHADGPLAWARAAGGNLLGGK